MLAKRASDCRTDHFVCNLHSRDNLLFTRFCACSRCRHRFPRSLRWTYRPGCSHRRFVRFFRRLDWFKLGDATGQIPFTLTSYSFESEVRLFPSDRSCNGREWAKIHSVNAVMPTHSIQCLQLRAWCDVSAFLGLRHRWDRHDSWSLHLRLHWHDHWINSGCCAGQIRTWPSISCLPSHWLNLSNTRVHLSYHGD